MSEKHKEAIQMPKEIMGAFTCRICGRVFPLIIEKHYVARADKGNGVLSSLASSEPKLYDAFDCPHCGCQNSMGLRLRVNNDASPEQTNEEESKEEDN